MILHFSQIGFTEERTFTANPPFSLIQNFALHADISIPLISFDCKQFFPYFKPILSHFRNAGFPSPKGFYITGQDFLNVKDPRSLGGLLL
jgi:hypothetical protein